MSKTKFFIFARGGSKGVHEKNIYDLNGKPLIAYTIEAALKSRYFDKLVVSTDCPKIARVAKAYGATVALMRPGELCQDDSPEWLSWQHAINALYANDTFDIFVSLPATAPLRITDDIDNCIESYIQSDCDILLTGTQSKRHPMFNMVKRNNDGYVELAQKSQHEYYRRQDVASVYDLTTVAYVSSPDFILNHSGIFDGKVSLYEIPVERALDIDDSYDMQLAEYLLSKREVALENE